LTSLRITKGLSQSEKRVRFTLGEARFSLCERPLVMQPSHLWFYKIGGVSSNETTKKNFLEG
jgi:hypothetical protein